MICEIRTYRVAPGRLDELVTTMRSVAPMLRECGIDVVAIRPSLAPDEGEHAVLIRAFESLSDRDRLEDAFYSSDAWRSGPRQAVLDPIESYHTVLLDLPAEAIESLRAAG